MIRLEAKNVIINQKGSFNWYAEIRSWIPNRRKKQLIKERMICRIHRKIPDIKILNDSFQSSCPQGII